MTKQHIRYGIIGTGMMGIEHIQNILALDDTSVVAIADTDERSLANGLQAAGDGLHCVHRLRRSPRRRLASTRSSSSPPTSPTST